jgi:predicted ATPase
MVKGISEAINVYEVVGAGPLRGHFELATRRGLTKFVGREREVAEMKRALELACSGHGQIVAAVAEAGTGKSRLVHEFKAMLLGDCKVLEAYSVSHGKASAYLPVLEFLYRYFGIEDADGKAERRAKVETRISALDPALKDTLPLLYTLMGLHEGPDPTAQMDPQIKRRRMLDAIKRIMLRESLNQPTVVIFEDLHWIDGETQTLLDLLADGIANARLLLLFNYRPEYSHGWTNKSYYTQLRLGPLGPENAAEMLSTLLGNGVELSPLKRMVIERTEGNPFFIEEMVQALFDEGALVRNGAVKIARSLSQLRLPPTVQGVLASRIDRLSNEQKELMQTLAVIGMESLLGLLGKVVSRTEVQQLERMLEDLQAGELIYEQPATGDIE